MPGTNVVESGRHYDVSHWHAVSQESTCQIVVKYLLANQNVEITVIQDLGRNLAVNERKESQESLKLLQDKPLKLIDDLKNSFS